jgi:2-C-methyl-D-erythritol 2,4-cyclodiphosphate synthase
VNPNTRFGFGYDVHRLVENRKLILGGIEIPFEKGSLGHSDGDALLHAIANALLGAAALGDIGQHFPETDPKYKDISSLKILERASALLHEHGFAATNIDCTVVLQQPKVLPYTERMRSKIATALGLPIERVSVKATTHEGLGFIGAGDGVAAYAVASIQEES